MDRHDGMSGALHGGCEIVGEGGERATRFGS
jgi:hypothetical protein